MVSDLIKRNWANSEMADVYCWKAYFDFTPEHIKQKVGLQYSIIGPLLCFAMPAFDILAFNRAICISTAPLSDQYIKDVEDFYRSRGVVRMVVQLPTWGDNEQKEGLLLNNGFTYHNRWVKLQTNFGQNNILPSHYLKIKEATEANRDDLANIISSAFNFNAEIGYIFSSPLGQQDWHFYLACDESRPISVSGLHIYNSVASLSIGATLADARGKKAQQALIDFRAGQARTLGCSLLQVETGEDKPETPNISFRNMVKFGMKTVYYKNNYLLRF